jgi:hypothetical protein
MSLNFNLSLLIFLFLSISLTSCESKKSEIHSQSPDGISQVTIYGSKSMMEPWNLIIEIKSGNKSDKLETQLYGDEINEKNIIFSWEDNSICNITLIDQDDTQRTLKISI